MTHSSTVRSATAEAKLDALAALLRDAPLNLLSHGERLRVRDVHVEECWAVGRLLGCRQGQSWVDLGTGGGLPGLVLAIQSPEVTWTLIDATQKKVGAVLSFVAQLELPNVRVVAGRAEDLAHDPAHRGRYDGVVSRALAALPVVVELSRGFLRPGGLVAAVKGPAVADEIADLERALPLLRLRSVHSQPVAFAVRDSRLVTMTAIGRVPRTVPRPDGVPQRQPLGGGSRP